MFTHIYSRRKEQKTFSDKKVSGKGLTRIIMLDSINNAINLKQKAFKLWPELQRRTNFTIFSLILWQIRHDTSYTPQNI